MDRNSHPYNFASAPPRADEQQNPGDGGASHQQHAQQQQPGGQSAQQMPVTTTYGASPTATSDYSALNSARSDQSFSAHMSQRPYPSVHTTMNNLTSVSMPPQSSASLAHHNQQAFLPPANDQYGHHVPPSHYQQQHSAPLYNGGTRPDWGAAYSGHPTMTATPMAYPPTPTSAGPRPGHQVYSFVPIPGSAQHKRPRRRYEEIERMYKCGWHGCEKAYGTLNHLNAHVTMQSHGNKRTPEEFKEIRREWKARKKEEETARKAAEERQRGHMMTATPSLQNTGIPQNPPLQQTQATTPGVSGNPGPRLAPMEGYY